MKTVVCIAIFGIAALAARAEDVGRVTIGNHVMSVEKAVVWKVSWSRSHRELALRMRKGTVIEDDSKRARTIFWALATLRGGADGNVVFLLERESPSRVIGTAVFLLAGRPSTCRVSGQWLLGASLEGNCGSAGAMSAQFVADEIETPFSSVGQVGRIAGLAVPAWDTIEVLKCSCPEKVLGRWIPASNGGHFAWVPLLEGELYVRVDRQLENGAPGQAEICEHATFGDPGNAACQMRSVQISRKSSCIISVQISGHAAFQACADLVVSSGLWDNINSALVEMSRPP